MSSLSPEQLKRQALQAQEAWKKLFKQKRKQIEAADHVVHALHQEVFEHTNCLECANCCRTLGPEIFDKDVDRMAKALRMRPAQVVEQYLQLDTDGSYVYKSMPCPFLMPDNYCAIYEYRPKACREYPHTDRRRFHQIYALSVKNAQTCPAVYEVLERLREEIG